MLAAWVLALVVVAAAGAGATAARAQPAQEGVATQDVALAAAAFEAGAALPPWADLAPLVPEASVAGEPVVVRLADTQLHLGPPRTALLKRVIEVLDPQALSEIGHVQVDFNPRYQRLRVHELRILRGHETVDHTHSAAWRFLQRERELEEGVVSGTITASAVLPDVRVGDMLQVVMSIEGANPALGQAFTADAHWERPHPIGLRRVTVHVPPGRQVAWRWVGGAAGPGPAPREWVGDDGWRRLRFEGRALPASADEPYLPPHVWPQRWLQLSEYANWNAVARWALTLLPEDTALPPSMEPVMARLRAAPDADAQVSQALQWVQAEIRNWSLALGVGSHRPRPPAEVVASRFGDCKDKAVLLVRMLRELGHAARPVLASTRTGQGPAFLLPTPEAFDHMIVGVVVDGREHFLDPTRQGQVGRLERMGQALEEAAVLPVDAAADGLLRVRSPNRDQIFSQSLTERFVLGRFRAPASFEMEIEWTGLTAERLRSGLGQLGPLDLERIVLIDYQTIYPGIRVVGEPQVHDDLQLNRLTLKARFEVPELAREIDGAWVVPYAANLLQGSFVMPRQLERQLPVAVPSYPYRKTYRVEMTWPEIVAAAEDPVLQALETPHFSYQSVHSFRGNVERRALRFEPRVAEVPAAELPRLLSDVRALNESLGGSLVVTSAEMPAAAEPEGRLAAMRQRWAEEREQQVERAGRRLAGGQLAGGDLAMALCSRASAQVELGRATLALDDAREAVRAAPHLGPPWLCLGAAQLALGAFDAADAAYTRALPLLDATAPAQFRRGLARFYAGRLPAAAEDFERAARDALDERDATYARLWLWRTLQDLGRPVPAELQRLAAAPVAGPWPQPALTLLAGAADPAALLAPMTRAEGARAALDLAEGWFYAGVALRAQGRREAAREAFERTLGFGFTMELAHTLAGFERARLDAGR